MGRKPDPQVPGRAVDDEDPDRSPMDSAPDAEGLDIESLERDRRKSMGPRKGPGRAGAPSDGKS